MDEYGWYRDELDLHMDVDDFVIFPKSWPSTGGGDMAGIRMSRDPT